MENSAEVLVRATVKLRGLRVGEQVIVDASDPYIRACLASRMLVPVDDDSRQREATAA